MNAYANLNQLKGDSFLATNETKFDDELLSALEEGSREIEKDTDRFFYLWEGSRYYDGGATRVIFDDDVYSITTLKVDTDGDGVYESTYNLTTNPVDAFIYPFNTTPKTRMEANPWGAYGHFGAGFRKAIELTGVFGHGDDYPASTPALVSPVLSAALNSTAVTMGITDSSVFSAGQTIKIGSEQMYINSPFGGLTVPIQRAVNGTIAGTHISTDPIYFYTYPKAITKAVLIYAMRTWKRKESAFQNVVASPELGSFTVWKGSDPDYAKAVRLYQKVRRGWYL
jgi:hypothetical protein